MASAVAAVLNAAVLVPAFGVASGVVAAYGSHVLLTRRSEWAVWAAWFFRGPGRTMRVLLALFVLLNMKSMPLVWTARVFGAMIRHTILRRRPLTPAALFRYSRSTTRNVMLETDYNWHKSNSTYFSDLDVSRTHLVMHLLGPGVAAAGRNATTKLVCKPAAEGGEPYAGAFGVGLGAVFCSFRREIAPFQRYELWSRVLAWDRKWLYVVTHFVVAGKVRPCDGRSAVDEAALQKHVIATAISKYVFKIGRFTVHPTYLLEVSGVLPPRPGEGWRGGGPDAVGDMTESVEAADASDDASWDWKRVEHMRRSGMSFAGRLVALDEAGALFDGGKGGILGDFAPA